MEKWVTVEMRADVRLQRRGAHRACGLILLAGIQKKSLGLGSAELYVLEGRHGTVPMLAKALGLSGKVGLGRPSQPVLRARGVCQGRRAALRSCRALPDTDPCIILVFVCVTRKKSQEVAGLLRLRSLEHPISASNMRVKQD